MQGSPPCTPQTGRAVCGWSAAEYHTLLAPTKTCRDASAAPSAGQEQPGATLTRQTVQQAKGKRSPPVTMTGGIHREGMQLTEAGLESGGTVSGRSGARRGKHAPVKVPAKYQVGIHTPHRHCCVQAQNNGMCCPSMQRAQIAWRCSGDNPTQPTTHTSPAPHQPRAGAKASHVEQGPGESWHTPTPHAVDTQTRTHICVSAGTAPLRRIELRLPA